MNMTSIVSKAVLTAMLLCAVLASGCSRRTPSMGQASGAAPKGSSADAAITSRAGAVAIDGAVATKVKVALPLFGAPIKSCDTLAETGKGAHNKMF